MSIMDVDDLFRKTRAFLSNQISRDTSIAREAIAFLFGALLWMMSVHQSLTVANTCQSPGHTSCSPNQSFRADQIRTEKRHLKNRWAALSWTWLQSLQSPQFCQPLRSSLSAVQTRFWRINQAKILHLGGAHGFQTNVGIGELVRPKNCIL